MKREAPKYALICWPDAYDQELPCCIHLESVKGAQMKGAVLIAVEDCELTAVQVDRFNPPRVVDDDAA